jgi:hypothetical protein
MKPDVSVKKGTVEDVRLYLDLMDTYLEALS